MKKTSCFSPAHILLPSEQIKLKQWGCVACDQFTSDRSYWEKAEWAAAGSPSALNLILPEVYLEDEGPGIEDDVKTRIFDKFYQADGSHKAEGNGLGLALVKRIVDSAGGTIKAENREYGGCRFVVELPIQKDEAI